MKVQVDPAFEAYFNDGDETAAELFERNGPELQALRAYYDFFANTLWSGDRQLGAVPTMLSMNAFMLFMSGVRMAMTGHVAAIFPLLRTALESACYAFIMAKDASLETIWTQRHSDEASRKLCRKRFGSAVADTVAALNVMQEDSGTWIAEAYDASIDFGAHPNVRSVFRHVSFDEESDPNFAIVRLGALYSSDAPGTRAGLIACMDYGLATAIVLARAFGDLTPELGAALNRLNDLKESAVTANAIVS